MVPEKRKSKNAIYNGLNKREEYLGKLGIAGSPKSPHRDSDRTNSEFKNGNRRSGDLSPHMPRTTSHNNTHLIMSKIQYGTANQSEILSNSHISGISPTLVTTQTYTNLDSHLSKVNFKSFTD